jgi:hypothetical protein
MELVVEHAREAADHMDTLGQFRGGFAGRR